MLQESAMILYNLFNLPIITLFPHLTTPTHIKHTNIPDTAGTHIVSPLYVCTLSFAKYCLILDLVVSRDNWL